jgi:hypothetical protein
MGVNKISSKPAEATAELTKVEQKAAPLAEMAIEHPGAFEQGGPTTDTPAVEEELSTASTHPKSVLIGSGEYQLSYIALEARRDSGLTTAKWNDLTVKERSDLMQTTIDRLREEAKSEKFSTPAPAGDTTVQAEDVRVHETRGVGGRFVALGGGERIRVAEASTNSDDLIPDDADLQSA